jgi:hypothetical protein
MFHKPKAMLFAIALSAAAFGGLVSGARPALADDPPAEIVTTFSSDGNSMTVTVYTPQYNEPAVQYAQPNLALDQNGNPSPGQATNFFSFDPTRFRPVCSTTASLVASGLTFNPILPGAFPGPSAPPQSGFTPNPGAGSQTGSTTFGAPFPLGSASFTTLQATPLGYQCYSNPFSIVPGSITIIGDATGSSFVTYAPIPQPVN